MNSEHHNNNENSLEQDVETQQQLVFENNGEDGNSTPTTKILEDITSIDLSSSRQNIGKFINSDIVEGAILTMMITDAIMMGMRTFDFVLENANHNQAFYLVDIIFLTIFTVELSFHIYHLGFNFFKDNWRLLDLVLILAIWVFDIGITLKAIGALRILRILPRVRTLRQVMISIAVVMPKMGAVVSLLSLIMFIFTILLTQLFG